MKTVLTIWLACILCANAQGQDHSTESLQKFTRLKVYDRMNVTLIKGTENKITVSDGDVSDLVIIEDNGQLKLRINREGLVSTDMIDADLYYTEVLTLLDANENGRIHSSETITGTLLELKAQEAALIVLRLDVENVTVKSSAGSEIKLSGTALTQEVYVNTGAKAYNKELSTSETTVTVLAGGQAEVHGTEKVIARVKAGSSVTIYGSPKIVDKDNNFGGKIHEVH